MNDKNLKNLNLENPRIFFFEIREQNSIRYTHREHVHNLNIKMGAKRPKSLVLNKNPKSAQAADLTGTL